MSYTPSTDHFRAEYVLGTTGGQEAANEAAAEFDRWLEAVRQEAKVEILREIEDAARREILRQTDRGGGGRMRQSDPDPQSARRRMEREQWQKRKRELEWLAEETIEELLLDVPVARIRAVAEGLDLDELTEAEINIVLAAANKHTTISTKIPEVGM